MSESTSLVSHFVAVHSIWTILVRRLCLAAMYLIDTYSYQWCTHVYIDTRARIHAITLPFLYTHAHTCARHCALPHKQFNEISFVWLYKSARVCAHICAPVCVNERKATERPHCNISLCVCSPERYTYICNNRAFVYISHIYVVRWPCDGNFYERCGVGNPGGGSARGSMHNFQLHFEVLTMYVCKKVRTVCRAALRSARCADAQFDSAAQWTCAWHRPPSVGCWMRSRGNVARTHHPLSLSPPNSTRFIMRPRRLAAHNFFVCLYVWRMLLFFIHNLVCCCQRARAHSLTRFAPPPPSLAAVGWLRSVLCRYFLCHSSILLLLFRVCCAGAATALLLIS